MTVEMYSAISLVRPLGRTRRKPRVPFSWTLRLSSLKPRSRSFERQQLPTPEGRLSQRVSLLLELRPDDGLTESYVFTFSGGLGRRCPEVGFEEIAIDLLQARLGHFHCCRGAPPRAPPPSISQPLIHNVPQRLALLKPAILVQKEAHRLILPIGRVVRAVRRQQNIIQLVQQMSRRQRFVLKHI
jgi:hypothetical protein